MTGINVCKFRLFRLLAAAAAAAAATLLAPGLNAAEPPPVRVVMLDPGHGGKDTGASGLNSGLEKNAALAISRQINKRLEGSYDVRMTRTDDYDVDIFDRISRANHEKADVTISVHAGGAFSRQIRGVTIYTFDDAGLHPAASPTPGPADMTAWKEGPVPWDDIQNRHLTQSKQLARILESALANTAHSVRVLSAPLLLLRGADMPAVMIEFGTITNPADEKALVDPDRQAEYADAVKQALDEFFERPSMEND